VGRDAGCGRMFADIESHKAAEQIHLSRSADGVESDPDVLPHSMCSVVSCKATTHGPVDRCEEYGASNSFVHDIVVWEVEKQGYIDCIPDSLVQEVLPSSEVGPIRL
jgi:hypothetical protein